MRAIRILLVAEDENEYNLIEKLLSGGIKESRYSLSWCSEYSRAVNAILKDRYDLYLVNYKIGDHSGIQLLNEAVKSNSTSPIIILTEKGDTSIDEKALEAGAADYFSKDQIDSERLERSIRYAAKRYETFKELKRNEHTFRILFERSSEAIVISDASGQILNANRRALRFFGLESTDIPEINSAFFYRFPGEREPLIEVLQRDGAVNDMHVELVNINGEVKNCRISSFVEIPQHGSSELLYTMVQDLSPSSHNAYPDDPQRGAAASNTQLTQSVRAIRTSLSKISKAIESKVDLKSDTTHTALIDTIRINASFADQVLLNLEKEVGGV